MKLGAARRVLICSIIASVALMNASIAGAGSPGDVVSSYSADVTNQQYYHRPNTPGDITHTDKDWSATWFTNDILRVNNPAPNNGNFNYITINLKPAVSGDYTVKIDSATGLLTGGKPDTQIWIYKDAFLPSQPLTNVLAVNEDIDYLGPSNTEVDGNWLSQISDISLEAGRTYVLVVTTYTAGVTGHVDFHISGPGSVTATGATLDPVPPNVSADDDANVIVGLDTTMEFLVDNGGYIRYDGTNAPDLSGTHEVKVRTAADAAAGTAASPSVTLYFTPNAQLTHAAAPGIDTDPGDLTVNVGEQADLSVAASGGVSLSYQWYSNTQNSPTGGTPIPSATSATYAAPTATAGTTYYYVVVTNTDGAATGNQTATATSAVAAVTVKALTHAAAPGIDTDPGDLTVNFGEQADLSVAASGGVSLSYQWYSNTQNSPTGGTPIPSATSATYAAPTATAGTTYYYVVVTNTDSAATGTKQATSTSAVAKVTVKALTYILGTIANQSGAKLLEGYSSGTQDTITVTLANNGTGALNHLQVALSGQQAGRFVITQPLLSSLSSGAPATSFTIKAADGLQAGTYTATVTVTADNMQPAAFTFTQIVELPPAPQAPVNLAATGGDAQAALSWNASTGADEYRIYAGTAPNQYESEPVATVTGTAYTVAGLTNGKTYYFMVQASNRGGVSAASNEATAKPMTVPAAPTNVQATAGDLHATVTFTAPTDNGGGSIASYEVTVWSGSTKIKTTAGTTSPITIEGLTNGTTYTFTVKALNAAGGSSSSALSNAVIPNSPVVVVVGGEPASANNNGVDVWVNGKAESAGTATSSTRTNQTVTTIAVDQQKLEERLKAEGQNAVITIVLHTDSDIVIGELDGRLVQSMKDKLATLVIRTDSATYSLPARQLDMSAVAERIGQSVSLQDIKVRIEIGAPTGDTVAIVNHAAEEGALTLVAPPVEFTVTASYGDQAVAVSKFDAYVERTIAIPEGVDPARITTGVVVDPDGTVRHVPTKISRIDGQYYAVLNSLTNSTYSVVWHPIEFSDLTNHWARNEINDMGSRLIVSGTGNGLFDPNRNITRAEFVATVVRGLGLKPGNGVSAFSDVKQADWYSGAIDAAIEYGLINGFEDGTFRPNDSITREQAMAIVAKAMAITGLKAKLSEQSSDETLHAYADASQASQWALQAIADSVQSGVVSGRSDTRLAPKQLITRAEAAAIIERLLQKSDLI